MEQSRVDRISALTRLSRERELTAEEQAERAELRREYIDSVRGSLVGHLENTYYVDEHGNKEKLKKKDQGKL